MVVPFLDFAVCWEIHIKYQSLLQMGAVLEAQSCLSEELQEVL